MPNEARLGSRELFPELVARAYVNHAAISPPSSVVRARVHEAVEDYARLGVSAFPRWEERRQQLRGDLAQLIGADAREIAFIPNTSMGLSHIALCFPWAAKDRIILFRGDFPANITPWQRAAELFDLTLVYLDAEPFAHEEGLALLEAELRRGARMVATSIVRFQSGLRMPVREMGQMCRRHGAELCVDAIQACGSVPIDVDRDCIDYLSTGSHKWLMGFEGAGMLFIRREKQAALRPYTAGWLSHENATDFLFLGPGHLQLDRGLRGEAAVFEGGTQSVLALAALSGSVPLLNQLGVEAIFDHVGKYLDALEPELVERGFESLRHEHPSHRSGLLCVMPPSGVDVIALAADLRNQGVITATPDGKLRFSPHFPNALDEVPAVVAAVDAALDRLR